MADHEPSPFSRRSVFKLGAVGAAGAFAGPIFFERLPAAAAPGAGVMGTTKPDIQFDVGNFIGPVRFFDKDGGELPADEANPLKFRFGPVYTKFVTFKLLADKQRYEPTKEEQQDLAAALDRLEAVYPFSPSGVFVFMSYGLPFFSRLPRTLVDRHMPKLLFDPSRWALEEAVPAPTDFGQPGINKPRFRVPPRITEYDMMMTLRSDSTAVIDDVVAWMRGSNKLKNQSVASPKFSSNLEMDHTQSLMVSLPGQPRNWAAQNALPFAGHIHPKSPMWMGFADQHITAAAAAPNVTFQGMAGRDADKQTTAMSGNYFDNGSVQHFSHVLLDLEEFYGEEYEERVGYTFRFTKHLADPYPNPNVASPPTSDGGPAYIENTFEGTGDAEANAQIGDMGHVAALQRSSRSTIDGVPLHIRLDGPGFDSLDMKASGIPSPYRDKNMPKLQFSIFVPSAEFFRTMRRNASAQDLVQGRVDEGDNGLEFFTTTTRRQNFLVPPRRNRSFPLVDLTRKVTDGYDTKLKKLLSEDKKVYVLQIVDDDVWAVEAGYSTTLQFEGGVPAGATIKKVMLYVRHYEEKDVSAKALVWQVGTGSMTNPTILASVAPAQYIDSVRETRAEWDVSAHITTAGQANELKLVIQNNCTRGKKSYVNNAYLWVDYS